MKYKSKEELKNEKILNEIAEKQFENLISISPEISALIDEEPAYKYDSEFHKEKYKQWVKNTEMFAETKKFKFVPGKNLIRLFFVEEKNEVHSDTIIVSKKLEQKSIRIYPIAKILSDSDTYKAGDIVEVPDNIIISVRNPQYNHHLEIVKEKPSLLRSPEYQIPPKYLNNLDNWKPYLYIIDKFKENLETEDAYTFLIPDIFIVRKI